MNRFWVILITLLHITPALFGQKPQSDRNILFKKISNNQGLSQSTVLSVHQDTLGYMWFATQDGLNRYDGFQFNIYRYNEHDSTAIISQYIRVLYSDQQGNLWIGGDKGISRYNYKYNNFENFSLFDQRYDRYISDIEQDQEGRLWAGSFSGMIYRYNYQNNRFSEYNISYNGEKLYYINDICILDHMLLIGTEFGLYALNLVNDSVKKIPLLISDPKIRKIIKESGDRIWIATEGHGLLQLDRQLNITKNYLHQVSNSNSLCNNNVRSLAFDDRGNLWIGTFIGLSILNLQSENFSNYYQDYTRPYTLSQNSVRSIFKDKEGGMWLGTFYGGINFYHPQNLHFDLINQNGSQLSLNDNVLSCITEDDEGNVWIGTNDGGINYWNRQSNTVDYFMHDESNHNSLSSNNIKAIVFTGNHQLLVGTHTSGLNLFDPVKRKNIRFTAGSTPGSIADNSVYALLKDHQSQIWVGTWQGLNKFDSETNTFEHFYSDAKGQQLTSGQITTLYEDSQQRIWIGTFDGLNIFYPEKRLFESFRHQPGDSASLSHNFINCVYEDSKKRIWIGTNSGLNIFNEIERNFSRIKIKEGFSDVFFGILEDGQDRMWMSTNQGIIAYDLKDRSFERYFVNDGIQNTQFNNYSWCKLSDGYFLFGGINGLTLFRPENIKTLPFNSTVLLTNLRINSQVIMADDPTEILNDHINQTKRIVLQHNQNTLTLNFGAINYIDNENISYLVKLENFHKQWWPSGNSITFSQLPPGEYTFKVKAVKGEIVGEHTTNLAIVILKPWYFSTGALLIYLLLFSAAGYFIYRFTLERIRTLHDLRVERLEKKKLSEINQMKLQFFTNISHEFRTPLTLILSPLEKILEKPFSDEWLKKQILLIHKNASRMLNLIDQLLEFRKSETGKLNLNASRNELVSFINDIYLSFASVAAQNKIVYTFNSSEQKLDICFDKNIVERIFFNLLSNAFKFTPIGGKIGINLCKTTKSVTIEVSDTGKGIAKDKLSLIFDRYYSVSENNTPMGTGIGLALTKRLIELHHGSIKVESEVNAGSRFIVNLPISEDVYAKNEISAISIENTTLNKPGELLLDDFEEEISESAESTNLESLLIVEDNLEIIAYLKENFLEKYRIYTAQNGEDALQLLQKSSPSVIISDVMMPVMDGIRLCKRIKQNIQTSHIPVILLTAKSTVEEQVEGLESGADDYVSKPFSIRVLERKVDNLIKSRKRLQEYYSKTLEIHPEKLAFNRLDQEILEKSKEIIDKHLSDPNFSVKIFAQEIGMSRSNLHLKLKAITGESATDFIKKIRLGKAVQLLEENKHSIAEISYMVGYGSPSYFTTSFKKYFGYLPTEYFEKKQ